MDGHNFLGVWDVRCILHGGIKAAWVQCFSGQKMLEKVRCTRNSRTPLPCELKHPGTCSTGGVEGSLTREAGPACGSLDVAA